MEKYKKMAVNYLIAMEMETFTNETLEKFLYDYPQILKAGYGDILTDILPKIKPQIANYFRVSPQCVYIQSFDCKGTQPERHGPARFVVVGDVDVKSVPFDQLFDILYIVGNANFSDISALSMLKKVYGNMEIVGTSRKNSLPMLNEVGGNLICEKCGLETINKDFLVGGSAEFKDCVLPVMKNEKITIKGDTKFKKCVFGEGHFDIDGKIYFDKNCSGKYPRINIPDAEDKPILKR